MSVGATNVTINTSVIGSPPQIGTQPSNEEALAGSTAQFTVGASGSSPLIYQWYFNTNTPLFTPSSTSRLVPARCDAPIGRALLGGGHQHLWQSHQQPGVADGRHPVRQQHRLTTRTGSVTLNSSDCPTSPLGLWADHNLAFPADWLPIFTNTTTTPNGLWQYIDTNAAKYPYRFYRFSTP